MDYPESLARNMLQQALQKVVPGTTETAILLRAMIQVTEADLADRIFFRQSVHGHRQSLLVKVFLEAIIKKQSL